MAQNALIGFSSTAITTTFGVALYNNHTAGIEKAGRYDFQRIWLELWGKFNELELKSRQNRLLFLQVVKLQDILNIFRSDDLDFYSFSRGFEQIKSD